MTRRERLMVTLRGEPVDRPAVNFYEIGGIPHDPDDQSEFNVCSDPSWRPLLQLVEEKTDLIRMRGPMITDAPNNRRAEFFKVEQYMENGSQFTRTEVNVGGRKLTSLFRVDPDVSTAWQIEHLLKDADDARAYLQLPDEVWAVKVDVSNMIAEEEALGDDGIVMMDTGDPICTVAALFSMEDYLVIAMTEQELFHELLAQNARAIYPIHAQVAEEFSGHLWRVCGAEYATEPYLPPYLFKEYVNRYTGPIIEMITKHGGFARLHSHGRIKSALPHMMEMGISALDPIEPYPQGNVDLADVRREYGKDIVLFGNLEASDVENLDPKEFEKTVAKSIQDGTSGEGRGFVLMPSSSPYGRQITAKTMANYETMVRLVGA